MNLPEEKIEPGEEALFEAFAKEIGAIQRRVARKGAMLRGFHAKVHAGVAAEFTVLPDLPEHTQHGVFEKPRTFSAVVRFSNGRSEINPDGTAEPRGIAVKLPEVGQDFLATSHSVTSAVRDIRQFRAVVRADRLGLLGGPYLLLSLGPSEAIRIVRALKEIKTSKVHSMATEVYSGTAPIKLGPHAVKFTIKPVSSGEKGPDFTSSPDFLRKDLALRLSQGDLEFDFVMQFFVDETRTPIEDTSVPWLEDVSPPVRLARLRIPKTYIEDAAGRAMTLAVDQMAFSPWNAIEDHRPLGNIMRARKLAYPASSKLRGAK